LRVVLRKSGPNSSWYANGSSGRLKSNPPTSTAKWRGQGLYSAWLCGQIQSL